MADTEQLRDDYTLGLDADDKLTPKAEALQETLDSVTKSAGDAAAAVAGVGAATAGAADKVTAASAAWDRVARRNDDVTAATYRLQAAQEQLTRTQAQAAAALAAGTANQDAVNNVLQKQQANVERLTALLMEVRAATEGAAEAEALWQAKLADGDDLYKLLATSAQESAEATIRASAENAVYGTSLDSLRAKWDPVFERSQAYQAQLASLTDAISKGALPSIELQTAAFDRLNASFAEGGATIDETRAKYSPLVAENQKYTTAVQALGEEIKLGLLPSLAEQSAALNKLVTDHERAVEAITGTQAATASAAQSMQAATNTFAGVTPLSTPQQQQQRGEDLGAAFDISNYDAARAAFDKTFAATQTLQAGMKNLQAVILNTDVDTEVAVARFNELTAAFDKATAAAEANGATADETRAKYDPLFAETQRYTEALKTLEEEIGGGLLSSYDVANAALNKVIDDHERIVESITKEQAATTASAAEQAKSAAAVIAAAAAMDTLRAKYDPDFAARQKQISQLEDLQQVILNTPISAAAAEAALNKITGALADNGAAADETRAKYDPLFAESQRYTAALKDLEAEITSGLLPSYDLASTALDKVVADHEKAVEAITGTQAATAAAAADQVKANAASVAAATAMDNLRAKYDADFAAQQKRITQLNELQEVIQNTNITTAAASKALADINTAYTKATQGANGVTVSHGQAAFAVRQLGVQSVQFFSSLEAGQSVFTAFIQQGHQVIDVALATGTGFGVLKDAAKAAFAAITSPIGIVVSTMVTAAVAIGGFTIAAASSQSALAKLRTELSATRDDYVAMADEVKKAGGLVAAATPATTPQATASAQSIAANPAFDGGTAKLAEMTKTAVYLAQVLGEDIPAATKRLTDAMQDPTKAALALASTADPLKALDAQTLDLIISLDRAGDHARAAALTYQVMSDAAKVAESQQTALAKAFEHLSSSLHSSSEDGKGWMQQFGDGMTAVIAGLIESVADLIDKLNSVPDAVKRARDSTTKGPTGAAGGNTSVLDYIAAALSGGQSGFVPNAPSNAPLTQLPSVNNPAAIQEQADINRSYIQSANQFAQASADLQKVILSYVQRESSFQQLNPATGKPVTSTSGAQGLFQIMPGTAGGRDITSATGNINTGLDLFNQYAAKYKGKGVGAVSDTVLVDMAMVMGEGFTDQFISGAKSLADLSTSKRSDIQHDTGFDVTSFLRSNPPSLPLNQQQQAQSDAVGGVVQLANMDAQAKHISDLNDQYRKLSATLGQVEAAVAVQGFATPQQQTEIVKYSAAIAQNREEFDKTTNTLKASTDAYHDQAAAAGLLGAAEQKYAEIQIAANRANANQPLSAASQTQVAAEQAAAMGLLAAQFDQQSKKLDQSTQQTNDNADAILKGTAAVTQATAAHKALLDVQDHFLASDPQYQTALAKRTQQYLDQADAAKKAAVNQELLQNSNTIDLLNTEISTLGEDSDARELLIQHLKDEQDIRLKYGDTLDSTQAKLLAERDQIAKLNQSYRDQQNTLSYLSQQFSSAFDSIGNSITQAFVQGSGAGVKFSSVMQGVVTQLIQQFAHLAVLNPLMNSLFGQNQPTLNSVLNLFGGGSSGGSSASGIVGTAAQLVNLGGGQQALALVGGGGAVGGVGSLIGTQPVGAGPTVGGDIPWDLPAGAFQQLTAPAAATASGGSSLLSTGSNLITGIGLLDKLGFTNIGGQFSGITNSLGLTGPGGLFGSGSGVLGGVSSVLDTPLISGIGTQFGPVTSGLAEAGAGLPASLTVGSLIGGVGAGYGVGSLVGGFVQSSLGKVGPAPEIGAATGAIAGAVIGSVVPVIGTLAGALIGGVIGGGGGGLIGPKAPSAFSSTMVDLTSGGELSVGGTTSQKINASAERSGALSDVDTINQILQQRGLTISSLAGANTNAQYFQVGQNTPGGFQDPSKYSSVGAAFPDFRFQSNDPLTQQFIQGRSFASPDELQGVTTSLADFEAALKGTSAEADTTSLAMNALSGVANTGVQPALQKVATFITSTVPTLTAGNPGSLATAQSQVYAQFSDAIAESQSLGGYDLDQLTAAQQKAYDKNSQVANALLDSTAAASQSNYLTASAQITGNPQDALNAQLVAFDSSAKQQRQQFSDQLTGMFGDAYATTADYAQRMADNDKATAEQRLAIQVQFNQQQVAIAQASSDQLRSLQARFATAQAALSGSPQQIQAAQVQTLASQQQAERTSYTQSEQQTYGAQFGTNDPDNLDKWVALLSAQANEMAVLQQQIARQNLELQVASDQQDSSVTVRTANATAALYPQVAPQAALYAFDVQSSDEQQNLYLSLTATYGAAYATTKEYSDKVLALQEAEGQERLVLEQTLADRTRQIQAASQQQNQGFTTRYENAAAQITGTPQALGAAQLDALDAQASAELENTKESLLQSYGDAYANTQDYGDKIALLTKAQGEERLALEKQIADSITAVADQAAETAAATARTNLENQYSSEQQMAGFTTRYATAAAQLSGSVAQQNAAALAAFDAQAQAEQQNLYLSLTATYGIAYATTADYASKLNALAAAQGEERLALQQQQHDALVSQASSSISSLNQYAVGLQTSDKSPLSPQAQLDLAQKQFDTQASLAAGGDFSAVQTLQQYSDAYLTAAHAVYGSGINYVQAFGKVVTALASVGAQSPDALTASVVQTETRTQTAILVEQLQELQDEVKQLRLQLTQGTSAPARVS